MTAPPPAAAELDAPDPLEPQLPTYPAGTLPLFNSKYVRSHPKYPSAPVVGYAEPHAVLTTRFPTDVHTAAYSAPSLPYRLAKEVLAAAPEAVAMTHFIADVDCGEAHRAGGAASDDWWTAEKEKLQPLSASDSAPFIYRTRGGYRIVWALAQPFPLRGEQDAAVWSKTYVTALVHLKQAYGIVADPTCKDWTRLYRVPHATREEGEQPENLETMGSPTDIGTLDITSVPALEEMEDTISELANTSKPWEQALRRLRRQDEQRKKVRKKKEPALNQSNAQLQAHVPDLSDAAVERLAPGVWREGERHTGMLSIAGTFRRRGASNSDLTRLLFAANQRACDPPLALKEVQDIAHYVVKQQPCVLLPLTETGNAERFVADHGADVRYNKNRREWMHWVGSHWAYSERGEVERRMKHTVRTILLDAMFEDDPERREKIVAHAQRSESAKARNAALLLAAHEKGIAVLHSDFDLNKDVINTPNGEVDLRTGELRPHRREQMHSRLAGAPYDSSAKCDRWLYVFLRRIFDKDPDLELFAQRAFGYCLTGHVSAQAIFFLLGAGANGKTTLLNILLRLLGDYAKQAEPELLLSKKGEVHPTGVADLCGTRVAVCTELDQGRRWDEANLKRLTGGDRIKARFMRKDFFEFDPTFKLLVGANSAPFVRGQDHGFWRRMLQVPFGVTIPVEERDDKLEAKLWEEAPGIMRWAVDGAVKWYADGGGMKGLMVPRAVLDATDAYKKDSDILGEFLEDAVVRDENGRVAKSWLYSMYETHAERVGERAASAKMFGVWMKERGFKDARNGCTRYWLGIKQNGVDPFAEEPPLKPQHPAHAAALAASSHDVITDF